MNNILLTGISGFVGQYLSEYFHKTKLANIISINLRNELPAILIDADAIIHLAGKAHDTSNTSSIQEYFVVNTELTKELFDRFLLSSVKDFIYFSSVKAVADTVEDILKEDIRANPKTPYGQSKLQAEEYLLSKELPSGKRLFILRPCMIHGPGNKGNLNLLYKVVKKGIPYPLGAFENKRSFLSIDNLIFIIEKIINDTSIPSGIYNVADDLAISTNEVIEIIATSSNTKARIWNISKSLFTFIAKVGDKIHLPLNTERLKKLTESYVVSNDKIKGALGIKELPTTSKEGLIKTIKSFG